MLKNQYFLQSFFYKKLKELINQFNVNKMSEISEKNLKEAVFAAVWWSNQIKLTPHTNIYKFRCELQDLINERIVEHWYPDEPSKGSGYRAIINDYHIDPILLKACRNSNISPRKLPGQCVQLISPGIVRVRSLFNEKEIIIYENYKLE